MKKFFALLCTMAMVMSLFSGIVIADDKPALELTLDNSKIIAYNHNNSPSTNAGKTYRITGSVLVGGSVPEGVVNIAIKEKTGASSWGSPVFTTMAKGYFNLEVPGDVLAAGKTYGVFATTQPAGQPGANDTLYNDAEEKTFTLVYKVNFDQDLSGLKYNSSDFGLLTGKVLDAEDKGVKDVTLRINYDGSNSAESTATTSQGNFAIALGTIGVAGDDAFVVEGKVLTGDYIEYAKYDVTAGTLKISDQTTNTVANIKATSISGTVKDADSNQLTSNLVATITGVRVKPATGTSPISSQSTAVSGTDYYTKLTINWGGEVIFVETGTATVKVSWNGGKLTGSYTINVESPGAVNISLSQSEYSIGSIIESFDVILVDQVDASGNPVYRPEKVDVTIEVNGKTYEKVDAQALPIGETAADSEKIYYQGGKVYFNVPAEQAGTIKVTVKAYRAGKVYGTATATATISGLNVSSDLREVTVSKDAQHTFVITLTDADGNPINNARVYLVNKTFDPANNTHLENGLPKSAYVKYSVDGTSKNILNGEYKFSDKKFTTAENYNLVVYQGTTLKAFFTDFFVVKGEEVYTLEVDKTSVLAGTSNSYLVTVRNAEGNIVPVYEVVAYKDGSKVATDSVKSWNSDKQYKLSNIVVTESLVLEARTDGGNKIGRATIDVVKPTLEISKAAVTDGVNQTYIVKLINPITGQPMKGRLDIGYTGLEAAPVIKNLDNVNLTLSTQAPATEFTFKMLVDAKAADDLEDDEVPAVIFKVQAVDNTTWVDKVAVLDVKPAALTVDKSEFIIGVDNEIVVSLKDANGDPLTSKTIVMNGTEIGKTDDNGQVAYSVFPAGTATYTFVFTNNASEDVKTTVKAVRDTVAPVVTINAPATTKDAVLTVTGLATDNVQVSRIFLNNREVIGIPGVDGLEFAAEVDLKVGANTLTVVAIDAAGNRGTATVTVIRELPTVVKLAIGSADATIDGTPAAGVAPYLKNNSTMVPFRFIGEALGAYVEWNAEAQTVTLSLDGTTVVLTIGSTTAFVNGEAKSMPVAPEITDGRTMVPLRFVGEALGAVVDYNAATGGITVTR